MPKNWLELGSTRARLAHITLDFVPLILLSGGRNHLDIPCLKNWGGLFRTGTGPINQPTFKLGGSKETDWYPKRGFPSQPWQVWYGEDSKEAESIYAGVLSHPVRPARSFRPFTKERKVQILFISHLVPTLHLLRASILHHHTTLLVSPFPSSSSLFQIKYLHLK